MGHDIVIMFCLLNASQWSSIQIEFVSNFPESTNGELLTLLKSKKDEDRMQAAIKIGEEKDAKYLRAVTSLLDDPNQCVRGWAAWALGEIGDRRSIGPLIKAFVKYNEVSKTNNGQESGCLTTFYLALEKVSGKKFGLDVSKWQRWWMEENLLALLRAGIPGTPHLIIAGVVSGFFRALEAR